MSNISFINTDCIDELISKNIIKESNYKDSSATTFACDELTKKFPQLKDYDEIDLRSNVHKIIKSRMNDIIDKQNKPRILTSQIIESVDKYINELPENIDSSSYFSEFDKFKEIICRTYDIRSCERIMWKMFTSAFDKHRIVNVNIKTPKIKHIVRKSIEYAADLGFVSFFNQRNENGYRIAYNLFTQIWKQYKDTTEITFEKYMKKVRNIIYLNTVPPAEPHDTACYMAALTEKYPRMNEDPNMKLNDYSISYRDNIYIISSDYGKDPDPMLKVDVFGFGASWLACESDHFTFPYDYPEDEGSGRREIHNTIYEDESGSPYLTYYIKLNNLLGDAVNIIINEARHAQNIDELNACHEKWIDWLDLEYNESRIEKYWLKDYGGLCWSNVEEAKHAIELMSLFYRIYYDDDSDNYFIHDETPDDYKLFNNKEYINKHYVDTRAERLEYLSFKGVGLISLEFIYLRNKLTHENIIPEDYIQPCIIE